MQSDKKKIFVKTIDFSNHFGIDISTEIEKGLENKISFKGIFSDHTGDLESLINDLSVIDYNRFKIHSLGPQPEVLDIWFKNISRTSEIISQNCNRILLEQVKFNKFTTIEKTLYDWKSFDFKSSGYLDGILRTKGEHYSFLRSTILGTIYCHRITGFDLLILNIKQMRIITGAEILKLVGRKAKTSEEVKNNLSQFLIQQIVNYNSLVFKE